MKTRNTGKDFNQFIQVYQPEVTPLPFGGFYRLASKIRCVKCGRCDPPQSIQVIRVHKVQLPDFGMTDKEVLVKPVPNDEKLMTTMMLRACDNFVGCWNTCRPWQHLKVCQLPLRRRLMGSHDPHTCLCPKTPDCTCPQRCGNKGVWPCECGRMFGPHGKHQDACPVGLYKRHSSFSLDFMRSQLVRPRA